MLRVFFFVCPIGQYYLTFLHMIGQSKINERLDDMTPNRMLLDFSLCISYFNRDRDPMVVGFTATYAISAYHH